MAAISNSSPLILFSRIDELDLLRRVFEEILISPGVHEEVLVAGQQRPGADEVAAAPWIRVRVPLAAVGDPTLGALDVGEAEAIALASELGGAVPLLLDDRMACRAARARGLRVYGSAGVFRLAKELGLIEEVRPGVDRLREAGLFLSETVYRQILAEAGESANTG